MSIVDPDVDLLGQTPSPSPIHEKYKVLETHDTVTQLIKMK